MVSSKLVDWQRVAFDEAFTDITAKANKVDQSEFLHSGKYPIVDQGQNFIAGYTDDDKLVWGKDLPVVIFGDHTRILKYVDFPFVLGADGTKVLKPSKDIFPLFAYYQLSSFDIPSAGYSRHFKFLKDFSFQYPPLSEQKRIASLLARADRLRGLRRAAREQCDSLLQSVFLEMFGDLRRNEKKWSFIEFENIISKKKYSLTRGPFGGEIKKEIFVKEGYKVYEQKHAIYGDFSVGKYFIDEQKYKEMQSFAVFPGDLIVSCSGTVGKVSLVPETAKPGIINQALMKIRTNPEKVNTVFFKSLLETDYLQSVLFETASGTAIKNVKPLVTIRETLIPVPPLALQEEFARVVARVEALRARMDESARQGEALFQSLLAESFG